MAVNVLIMETAQKFMFVTKMSRPHRYTTNTDQQQRLPFRKRKKKSQKIVSNYIRFELDT